MDVERALLGKAINSGDFTDLLARGIEIEHFADPDCRELFQFGVDFMQIHGSPPSMQVVRREFDDVKLPLSQDPLSYHIEEFVLKVKERKATEVARDFYDAIDDPEQLAEIELHALEMARTLNDLVPAPRAHRFSDVNHRIAEYRRREQLGINHGIFLGIPSLDHEMLGLQPHEFAVIAAYLGKGKSTLMKKCAYACYLQNRTVAIVSLEEEAEAVLRKLDVMATNVKYHAMKALELGVGDMQAWEKLAERAYQDRHERDIIIVDDIRNCSPEHVMSIVARYKVDFVMVDYLELMKTPRGVKGWEGISENGIGLKQIARTMKVPIMTAAQLNREGGKGEVTLANVSHQSVGKHSDIIIGLAQDEEMEDQQEMDVILLKNRDGRRARARMRWQLEHMDIREKGTDELFPKRKNIPPRRKREKLEVARTIGEQKNPLTAQVRRGSHGRNHNPFTPRAK